MRIAVLAAVLVVAGSVFISRPHAAQPAPNPAAVALATNWIGYVVVGKEDTLDRIARGPHPTTVRQVELGLRSDGVVLWRSSTTR